jgi:hypothetical protein
LDADSEPGHLNSPCTCPVTFYKPVVDAYEAIGARTLFVFNQETYWGNGPWANGNWGIYVTGFAAVAREIAAAFDAKSVDFEIWNEGDNVSPASIFISPTTFGDLLAHSYRAIKAVNAGARVVSGGLVGPNQVGYLREALQAYAGTTIMDAIGVHPYGQWTRNFGTAPSFGAWFGKMETYLQLFRAAFPTMPLWLTEVGFDLIRPDTYDLVNTYVKGISNLGLELGDAKAPVAMWYCWSDGMNPGFGMADSQNQPKRAVFDPFIAAAKAASTAVPAASGAMGGVPAPFTNQQVINAFYAAAEAMGVAEEYWNWIFTAGLEDIAKDQETRRMPYSGVPIKDLPNLSAEQKDLVQRALNGENLMPDIQAEVKLTVPYVSQIDARGRGNADCGDACVLMLIKYRQSADPPPSRREVFSRLSGTTTAAELKGLAAIYDLNLQIRTLRSPVDLCTQIDAGNPVIVLVDYKQLGFRIHLASGIDQGDHWLLVVGYDGKGFIVHDPLWVESDNGGRGGNYLTVQYENARRAIHLRSEMLF